MRVMIEDAGSGKGRWRKQVIYLLEELLRMCWMKKRLGVIVHGRDGRRSGSTHGRFAPSCRGRRHSALLLLSPWGHSREARARTRCPDLASLPISRYACAIANFPETFPKGVPTWSRPRDPRQIRGFQNGATVRRKFLWMNNVGAR